MEAITREKAIVLMGASNVPAERVMQICSMQCLADPIFYFAKAVETEREHGAIGKALGTDVVGFDDRLAAKIALAHLLGVEYGHAPSEWKPCPYYYHELWSMESRCAGPREKRRSSTRKGKI